MKIIPVINGVYACVKTSVEDDSFLREGLLFTLRVFMFWIDRESIILGNFAISVCRYERKGAYV